MGRKMIYITSSKEIKHIFDADGIIEFSYNDILYRSVGQATFDNSPSNNFSTYSAPLVCPEDPDYPDYPDAIAGKLEWDIINKDCDDESNACDWYEFNVYLHYGAEITQKETAVLNK